MGPPPSTHARGPAGALDRCPRQPWQPRRRPLPHASACSARLAPSSYALHAPNPPHTHTLAQDLYQLARCKCALPLATMKKLGVPMPPAEVEVLHTGVAWDEFKVRAFACCARACACGGIAGWEWAATVLVAVLQDPWRWVV